MGLRLGAHSVFDDANLRNVSVSLEQIPYTLIIKLPFQLAQTGQILAPGPILSHHN